VSASPERLNPVFDVPASEFHSLVVETSHGTPVLVDFWASWCGPCKALAPVLEKLAGEASGRFLLAKVDTDANQELAAAQGVRSLPTVRLYVDGEPIAEFMGAHPESFVRGFLDQHLPSATDTGAIAGIAAFIDRGDADGARTALSALEEHQRNDARVGQLSARLAFMEEARDAEPRDRLELALTADPQNLDARYDLAVRDAAEGRFEEAMDALLLVLARNRQFREDAPRQAILRLFSALGEADPRVIAFRGRLASALH